MIKTVLFDVDGIVITARKQFFSEALAERQGIPKETVSEFFTGNFKKCSFGQCDLKEEVSPYLSKWNWKGSVDDLLELWFESESTKDESVLSIVKALREKGIRCYIATRQEKYRMQHLWSDVGLKDYFDGYFCTCDIGFDKSDPEFYKFILQELHCTPSEVIFFDDTQLNVDVAREEGIEAYFCANTNPVFEQTRSLID